jgi:hypothetical protein
MIIWYASRLIMDKSIVWIVLRYFFGEAESGYRVSSASPPLCFFGGNKTPRTRSGAKRRLAACSGDVEPLTTIYEPFPTIYEPFPIIYEPLTIDYERKNSIMNR